MFDQLPRPDQFGRILAQPEFNGFYGGVDLFPERVEAQIPVAAAALAGLARKIPENPYLQVILASTDPSYPRTPEAQLAAFNAFLAVGHLAALEEAKPQPDRELIRLIEDVYSVFRFQPHVLMHFWAGGLDARNPHVRGTVTYFNELCVDPVFWMLHGELDRLWYSWERTHPGLAPGLDGDDAVFQPIRPRHGAWCGGGRRYVLPELTDHSSLTYRYDRTYSV